VGVRDPTSGAGIAYRERPAARQWLAAAAVLAIHGALVQLFMPRLLRTRPLAAAQMPPLTVYLIAATRKVNSRTMLTHQGRPRRGHVATHDTMKSRASRSIGIASPALPSRTRVHWMQALQREARDLQSGASVSKRHFGIPHVEEFEPAHRPQPWPGWNHAVTHRMRELTTGGTLIMINDHCGIVFAPFPIIGCVLDQIKSNGNLFEHMHDRRPGSLP
jgi:hypothetical protein